MRDRYASLREGLVGAWIPSVSGSGLLLPDLSGQGNNGTLTNMGPEDWVAGDYGRALDFDGVDDYATTSKVVISGNVWTASIWAAYRSTATRQCFWSQYTSGTIGRAFLAINYDKTTGSLSANQLSFGTTGGLEALGTGTGTLSINKWYHIAVRAKGSEISLWVNGNQTATAAYSVSIEQSPFTIGRLGNLSTFYLDGLIDDVRAYNRALSEPEIKLLSQEPGVGFKRTRSVFDFGRKPAYLPPTPTDYRTVRVKQTEHASLREGLVGAWCPSIEGSGYTLPDLSGQGNNGTLTNMGPEDWVSSQYGRALDFDGVNDYVKCLKVPLTGSGALSISLWVMPKVVGVDDHAFKFGTATTNNAVGIFNNSSGKLTIGLHANNPSEASLPFNLTTGIFYHVVGTCQSSQRQIWLNGVLQAISSATVSYNITSAFCHIGAAQSGIVPWHGQLDDIRIYNRALSEPEIKLLASRPGIGLRPQRRTMYYAPPTGARRRRILTSMP